MGSPLRILHVVVNMNRGGAETLLMNLYRNIDRTKVQFDFLTCKEGVFDEEIIEMGGQIHRIPYVTESGPLGYMRALKKFFITNSEYSIVHSHMDKMSGLVLRAAKEANVPIRIAHSHNTESEGGILAKLFKWYAGNYISSSATHFYACSHAAARWLFKNRASEAYILKNGIEPNKFHYSPAIRKHIRNELNIAEDTLVLGHVGRFSNQKNHLYLLEIFSEVNREEPNSTLVLVGDGSLRPKIEEKIKELHIEEKVKILGIRKDIYALLQAFDLFIFPSLHEGLPVTLIEAQGAGLPCLISDSITKEVDMGAGLIEYLPLADKNRWTERILKSQRDRNPRMIEENYLSHNGYDIRTTAWNTQTAYLVLGRG